MRISSSEYISFLDSDDMWKEEKLSRQIDFMKKINLNLVLQIMKFFFEKLSEKNFYQAYKH